MCARFKGAQMEKLSTDRDTGTSFLKYSKNQPYREYRFFVKN